MDLSSYGEDLLDPNIDIEDYFDWNWNLFRNTKYKIKRKESTWGNITTRSAWALK
jgi:hypothetical protein